MQYVWAFVIGGGFCVLGQLLIDFTKLTPARVLVCFVVAGVVLSALDLYDPLAEFAGAGATVPLLGFGPVSYTHLWRKTRRGRNVRPAGRNPPARHPARTGLQRRAALCVCAHPLPCLPSNQTNFLALLYLEC